MMKTSKHPRFSNFEYRPDAYDDYIIREQGSYGRLKIQPFEAVMDVGGQIGAFVRWAAEQGAGPIISYEPDKENFKLLCCNTTTSLKQGLVNCVWAAVVGTDDEQVDLFINDKKNKGLHSTIPRRGRSAIRVPAVRFSSELAEFRPSVLKVDIEGGEYELDWAEALSAWKPRVIGLELHLTQKAWREEKAEALMDLIRSFGYEGGGPVPATSWTMLAFFNQVGS